MREGDGLPVHVGWAAVLGEADAVEVALKAVSSAEGAFAEVACV